ncbi:MAG: Crp/Fnr family transcriptional regulator [Cyanobacteria bacterium P01_A01_bin.40]
MAWYNYGRGHEISASDFGVWRVGRGIVQLSRIGADGNEVIVGFITANGTFENNLLSKSLVAYRAIALSDVDLQYFSQQNMADSPSLVKSLLVSFSDRLIKAQQLLTISLINNNQERLRELLLILKKEIGIPTANGVRLQIRFTHQHLANIICTTRVSITRILGDFKSQGLISFDAERHIVIKEL